MVPNLDQSNGSHRSKRQGWLLRSVRFAINSSKLTCRRIRFSFWFWGDRACPTQTCLSTTLYQDYRRVKMDALGKLENFSD